MKTKTTFMLAFLAATIAPSSAIAADVRVHYLLEERALRSVDASAEVQIALFTDAACTASTFATTVALGNVDLLARVAATPLHGMPKSAKAVELRHTLHDVPPGAPLYARVVGDAVVPIGPACQVQTVAVPAGNSPVIVDAAGAVLGPYAVAADSGQPIWLRSSNEITYAAVVEWGELRGLDWALHFETADCSSTPLIYTDYYSLMLFFPSVAHGTTLYYPVGPPSQRVVRAYSYQAATPADCTSGAFAPPDHCCQPIRPGPTFVGDFLETATTDLGQYRPPFHVELR